MRGATHGVLMVMALAITVIKPASVVHYGGRGVLVVVNGIIYMINGTYGGNNYKGL